MAKDHSTRFLPIILASLLGALTLFQSKLWPEHVTRLQMPLSVDFETAQRCVAAKGRQVVPGLQIYKLDIADHSKLPLNPDGITFQSPDGGFKLSIRPGDAGNEMVIKSISALSAEQYELFRRCSTPADTPTFQAPQT